MSTPTTREEMMARIRAALGRTEEVAPPAAPAVPDALLRLASAGEDLAERFACAAAAAGMTVHRLKAQELTRTITALLEQLSARRIATSVGTLAQAIGLNDYLRRKGFEILDWKNAAGLDAQFDLDAGITDVHGAIAETGTLVCQSDAGHSRGLSLVPPYHVAVVRRSDVVADLVDFAARFGDATGREMPSSIALITGPSKTADIEGIIVVGVHGPAQVHVLLVEDA